MRFSSIRTGVVATAAAIALAACGGHGMVPQSAAPGGSFNVIPEVTNPCYTKAVQPAWIFKGSCVITTLPTKGEKITLKAYKGVTEKITLPANNSKKATFVLVDAIGGSDISKWKRKALPAVPSTTGKSLLYTQAVNSQAGLKFTSGALEFVIKANKFPGKTCYLSLLKQTGTKFYWFKTPLSAPVKTGSVTYKIPYSALGIFFPPPKNLPAGPLFFNVACK